jgi:hypothetical protein
VFTSVWLVLTRAHAQDVVRFGNFSFDRANPSDVFLDGPIDGRSGLNFSRLLDAAGEARTLVLASEGGLVYVALTMA